ncbi:MAG: exo-alpha-sialidase, partial [Candidatus Omnitrophica bacterium]|nr:exo-alpha-sialidase [Candidatus Omnitrophota bacterium]
MIRIRPFILTTIVLSFGLSSIAAQSREIEHKTVFLEEGRFAGWPANQGIWSWGDEIVVGLTLGYYKKDPDGGHAIDPDRPKTLRQARSLDGGETWEIEKPGYLNEEGKESDPVQLKESIDFSNPDIALKFRSDKFYYSPDRCHSWEGPFQLPDFGREELLARTDYLIEGENRVTAFISASKEETDDEGQPLCIRTTDGGKSWDLIGWIGDQPPIGYGYAIMPSTVKLKSGAYLSMIRRAGVFDGDSRRWIEAFLSPDEGASWYLLKEPHIENYGNPASMVRLADDRIALTYGYRRAPQG